LGELTIFVYLACAPCSSTNRCKSHLGVRRAEWQPSPGQIGPRPSDFTVGLIERAHAPRPLKRGHRALRTFMRTARERSHCTSHSGHIGATGIGARHLTSVTSWSSGRPRPVARALRSSTATAGGERLGARSRGSARPHRASSVHRQARQAAHCDQGCVVSMRGRDKRERLALQLQN
jgi:hypothetical protein